MIWYYFIDAIRSFFVLVFSVLGIPVISVLPFGIDNVLSATLEYVRWFSGLFWWFSDIFVGGMIVLTYFATMFFLRQFRLIK